MRSRFRITVLAAALAVVLSAPADAYYYFVHYLPTGNAPEKFDLTALPYNTVTFLVSESGPTVYSATDTFNSVLGQIQQAARIWNSAGSSSLRVAYGGLENPMTAQNTPGGDVMFEDLPPGVEGFGGPTSLAAPVQAADGTWFFPIVRSVVHLSLNLTVAPGPSYGQAFLMTTLHEMGHSLGLQHTFTSATMSQNTTRATTLTHPLSSDDIAGLSALYPGAGFQQLGSISGQVTAGGSPVHLASVVAIAPGMDAVSAVTNPDGTFQINGVPPGQYALYVHTMPPDADIFGPWDTRNNPVAPSGPVNSLFYPATTSFAQAAQVTVQPGNITKNINIATTSRGNVPYYDGQVYGYLDNNTIGVTPGPVEISSNVTPVVASVVGLGSGGQTPGLSVQFPDPSIALASVTNAPNGIAPFSYQGYTYISLYLSLGSAAQAGLEHMIFNTPDYMYVLPSAMYLTQTGPPLVTGAASNGDGTVTVTGTNLTAASLIYFDSLPAAILSINLSTGSATVTPPAGASGQQATVTIFNPDGQNSWMLQSSSPVIYQYGSLSAPLIRTLSPSQLPAGAEAMVDITGTGFNFVQGRTSVGFGTSDVLVQRIFVQSPDHLQADVYVPPGAAQSLSDVSVMSGFELATFPQIFQIAPPVANLPVPYPDLINGLIGTGITGAYPGAVVSLYGSNLSTVSGIPGPGPVTVTIGGQPVNILYSSPNQLNLALPAGLTPGPAVMTLNNGQQNAFPVEVNIDPPPAGFGGVQSGVNGAYIDSTQPAYQGEILIATMVNFAPAGSTIANSQVQVTLGGVTHPALKVAEYGAIWQVTFQIGPNDPVGSAETLMVYLNGLSSLPATIQVLPAPSTASGN